MSDKKDKVIEYAAKVFDAYCAGKSTSLGVDIALAMLKKLGNQPLDEKDAMVLHLYEDECFGKED